MVNTTLKCAHTRLYLVTFALLVLSLPGLAGPRRNENSLLSDECRRLHATTKDIGTCLDQPRVWKQYPLASVRTGTTRNGKAVGRRMLIVAVGPFVKDAALASAAAKQLESLGDIGAGLALDIDRGIRSPDSQMAEALKNPTSQLNAESARISVAVANKLHPILQIASDRYRLRLKDVLDAAGVNADQFGLALVDTYCSEAEGCSLAGYVDRPHDPGFQRYGKLSAWIRVKPTPDGAYRLPLPGAPVAAPVIDSNVRHAVGRPWPRQAGDADTLENFERLVQRRRAQRIDVNYAAVDILGLSPRSMLAVADILDSPSYVAPRLKPDGTALKRASDELARTRLLECSRLRGILDPAAVGECAGYSVDYPELVSCLNAGYCLPPTGQKAVLDLMLIANRAKLQDLAVLNVFPRIKLGRNEAEFLAAAKACAANGLGGTDAANCVLRQQSGEKERQTLACIDAARRDGTVDAKSLSPCIAQFTRRSPALATVSKCVASVKGEARAVTLCTVESQLPESSRQVVACARQAMTSDGRVDKNVVANCLLGKNERAALACVRKSRDWQQGTLCAAGGLLPKPIAEAMDCLKSKSTAEAAVCLGGKSVPGEAGRLLRCAAESSFNSMGTALCMAGDNLTADQRILLQCAVTSGGEPVSTATCTAGNLAMKEFNNCKGKKFGEAPCFGPNNDLLRISKQLGVEIGPKSVVADYVNIQLRLLEVPMGVLEKPAAEAMRIAGTQAGAIVEGHKALLDAIAKGDLGGAVAQHVKNTCQTLSFGVIKC